VRTNFYADNGKQIFKLMCWSVCF